IEDIPQDMSRFYPEGYYSLGQKERRQAGRIARRLKKQRAKHILGRRSITGWIALKAFGPPSLPGWMRHVDMTLGSSILDLGCGRGSLLGYLAAQGFERLSGADPHIDEDLDFDDGVKIYKASLDKIEGEYDFILMNHSLEHMPDQRSVMSGVVKRLSAGGKVVIRIPLVSSDAWREYGVDWVQLDAPRHLFLHSERSMFILAEESGLSVRSVEYDSTAFQFWGSEQYRRGMALTGEDSYMVSPDRSMFTSDDMARFEDKARRLNETGSGDQACFILERIKG
ncbi:MAG TPA: class I SAM-dependent methyltransferase, partial [Candidatus Krumholzibacterium sp.]|nr:class I SAM-dependent methyltransferase [Candidatus Krumholzibacterium sp.]